LAPKGSEATVTVTKLIDNFDAGYEYITNIGTVFYFQTNKDAPRYKIMQELLFREMSSLRNENSRTMRAHTFISLRTSSVQRSSVRCFLIFWGHVLTEQNGNQGTSSPPSTLTSRTCPTGMTCCPTMPMCSGQACILLHSLGAVFMGDLWMTEGIRDSVAAFLTFVPTNSGVICTGKEYLVAIYMEHAQQTLTIFDILGKEVQKVALPDVGTVGSLKGRKEDFEFFYSFTGFVTPGIKYRFDLGIVERELLRELYQGQMNGCHIIIINGAPGREICWMRAAG